MESPARGFFFAREKEMIESVCEFIGKTEFRVRKQKSKSALKFDKAISIPLLGLAC